MLIADDAVQLREAVAKRLEVAVIVTPRMRPSSPTQLRCCPWTSTR